METAVQEPRHIEPASDRAVTRVVDEQALQAFAGKVLDDVAGAFALLLGYIGDRTGVYRALRDAGPSTASELAHVAGVDERCLDLLANRVPCQR